ncbi:MAG: hypothetical protein Q4F97_07145 [Bacteroidales bacterium]|nr:hypothetical protein [Bacteroidales bacterium]
MDKKENDKLLSVDNEKINELSCDLAVHSLMDWINPEYDDAIVREKMLEFISEREKDNL